MGTPLMRYRSISARASATRSSARSVTGSTIIPDSERLTLSTSAAWSVIDRLRWRIPMAPTRAMAMAMPASVTVSIAADAIGTESSMSRAIRVEVSTSFGRTDDAAGTSSTSSKVSASVPNLAAVSASFPGRGAPWRNASRG